SSPCLRPILLSRFSIFRLLIPRPPLSTLFPYTTLFRSHHRLDGHHPRPAPHDRRFPGGGRTGTFHLERRAGRPERHRSLGAQHEIGRHTSELQSRSELVCRLLLEKKKSCCRARTLRTSR